MAAGKFFQVLYDKAAVHNSKAGGFVMNPTIQTTPHAFNRFQERIARKDRKSIQRLLSQTYSDGCELMRDRDASLYLGHDRETDTQFVAVIKKKSATSVVVTTVLSMRFYKGNIAMRLCTAALS